MKLADAIALANDATRLATATPKELRDAMIALRKPAQSKEFGLVWDASRSNRKGESK